MKMPLNILPIVRKEFRQIRRDKRILGVLLFIPALMLVTFGYALTFDVKHTSMAIFDQDRTKTSREFAQLFFISEYFDRVWNLSSEHEIDRLLDGEHSRVVVIIPKGFSESLVMGRGAAVQVLVDGANSNAAATVLGYVGTIIQQYSLHVIASASMRVGGRTMSLPIDYQPRVWYNPELESAKFLVPGLIAFILMVTAVISTAMAVVREREHGTMEQIMVSPVRPIELILGKTIPYTIISFIATVAILTAGYFLFGVTIKGSLLLLFVVTLVFLVGALGLGLLISTLVETQQLAFMIAVILSMLPTFILSGFVFPIRNMPPVIQAITYIIPARYFLVALRAIILKGAGLSAFWDQLLLLTIYAVAMLSVSSLRLRRILK
jgi:ABC-2 type transport system permease protein